MKKTLEDINLYTWFSDRELSFVPEHFVRSNTPITSESKEWILEKLTGRFTILNAPGAFLSNMVPSFEDPKEAVFYELTWG